MFSQTRRIAAPGRRAGLFTRLLAMLTLHRHRRALSRLDDRLLDDIGLSQHQARAEQERPFWDVPPNWRL